MLAAYNGLLTYRVMTALLGEVSGESNDLMSLRLRIRQPQCSAGMRSSTFSAQLENRHQAISDDHCNLLLARASNEQQQGFVGNQSGGRIFLFVQTVDFWRDYNAKRVNGVYFCLDPQEEYGMVVVFEDIHGNG
ncbi:hypothetical protein [Pantoea sp. RIT-PI-b]|uniref:hypothetical protein n=1 Tax=Pantoea sp. RIT-PI-b TaxID=1681195 RepID=UPI001F48C087|nr:hypothetical protein [Pantoea sp. RIT-PI-b]